MTAEDRKRAEAIGLRIEAVEPITALYGNLVGEDGELTEVEKALFVMAAKAINAIYEIRGRKS